MNPVQNADFVKRVPPNGAAARQSVTALGELVWLWEEARAGHDDGQALARIRDIRFFANACLRSLRKPRKKAERLPLALFKTLLAMDKTRTRSPLKILKLRMCDRAKNSNNKRVKDLICQIGEPAVMLAGERLFRGSLKQKLIALQRVHTATKRGDPYGSPFRQYPDVRKFLQRLEAAGQKYALGKLRQVIAREWLAGNLGPR